MALVTVDIQDDSPFVHTAKSEGGHSSSLKKSRNVEGKVRIDQDRPLQNQLSPRQREEKREEAVWTGTSLRDIYSDDVNSLSDTEQGGLPVSGGIAGVTFGQVYTYTSGNQPHVSGLTDTEKSVGRHAHSLTMLPHAIRSYITSLHSFITTQSEAVAPY